MKNCFTYFSLIIILSLYSISFGQGYIALVGGGTEDYNSWSDKPYKWIVEHSTNKTIAVLSVNYETEWLTTYFKTLGAKDAYNLCINTKTLANSDEIYNKIVLADGIFVKGGDQSEYVRLWKGTKTESAIVEVFKRGGVVSGTSAGAHIMSEIVYDASNGSVYPEEAIRNPYNPRITFTYDFLNFVSGTIVDTHFTQRGRIGRLIPFIARLWKDNNKDILGIGIDDCTALLIEPTGIGKVVGQGSVTFVSRSSETEEIVKPGYPLAYTHVKYDQLTEDFTYNIKTRKIESVPSSAQRGASRPYPDIYIPTLLEGINTDGELKGTYYIKNIETSNALYYGELEIKHGDKLVGNSIIMTKVFDDPDYIENTIGGVEWGLAVKNHLLGIYLDNGAILQVNSDGVMDVITKNPQGPPVIFLDSYDVKYVDFSTYKNKPLSPRQSVALTGIVIHFLTTGMSYDAINHIPITNLSPAPRCGIILNNHYDFLSVIILGLLILYGIYYLARCFNPYSKLE